MQVWPERSKGSKEAYSTKIWETEFPAPVFQLFILFSWRFWPSGAPFLAFGGPVFGLRGPRFWPASGHLQFVFYLSFCHILSALIMIIVLRLNSEQEQYWKFLSLFDPAWALVCMPVTSWSCFTLLTHIILQCTMLSRKPR